MPVRRVESECRTPIIPIKRRHRQTVRTNEQFELCHSGRFLLLLFAAGPGAHHTSARSISVAASPIILIGWLFGDVSSPALACHPRVDPCQSPVLSASARLVAPVASLIRHIVDSLHIFVLQFRFSPITHRPYGGARMRCNRKRMILLSHLMCHSTCARHMYTSKQLAFDIDFFVGVTVLSPHPSSSSSSSSCKSHSFAFI